MRWLNRLIFTGARKSYAKRLNNHIALNGEHLEVVRSIRERCLLLASNESTLRRNAGLCYNFGRVMYSTEYRLILLEAATSLGYFNLLSCGTFPLGGKAAFARKPTCGRMVCEWRSCTR